MLLRRPQPGPPLPSVVPGMADPLQFTFPHAGAPALLLVHGFADTAAVMFPLGRLLDAQGFHVRGCTLPGHGRDLLAFAGVTEGALHEAVRVELAAMRGTHRTVLVAGFSMGGLLALHAAARGHAAGAVAICAPVELWPGRVGTVAARRVTAALSRRAWAMRRMTSLRDRRLAAYGVQYAYYPFAAVRTLYALMDHTRAVLSGVRTPVCLCQAGRDDVVAPRGVDALAAALVAAPVEVHRFPRSRHKLVLEAEHVALAEVIGRFARRVAEAEDRKVL